MPPALTSRLRALILLAALAAMWVVFVPSPAAATPADDLDAGVAYQVFFRSQTDFLDTSLETIHARLAEQPDNGSMERWGLYLSDAELAEMNRRQELARWYPELAAAAVGDDWSEELVEGLDPDGTFGAYAGHWIDPDNGDRLVLALVETHPDYDGALARVEARLQQLVAEGKLAATDVVLRSARYTADELYAVDAAFNDMYLTPAAANVVVMSASINPIDNRVDLYTSPEWRGSAERFAAGYPADLVQIVEVPESDLRPEYQATPRTDWGYGAAHSGAAVWIHSSTQILSECTWGATIRTNSYVYAVVAAHCLGFGFPSEGAYWGQSQNYANARGIQMIGGNHWITHPLDDEVFIRYYNAERGDIARVAIYRPGATARYDCYLEGTTWCGRLMSRREYTSETNLNEWKCAARGGIEPGIRNGYSYVCARLISNDTPITGRKWIRRLDTDISTQSVNGDSGAGWKEGSLLTGIHLGSIGGSAADTIFTHAYYLENIPGIDANAVCGTSGLCTK